jgi:ABC-type polysaccharide/polyol phosphate transport system ATPase subunit
MESFDFCGIYNEIYIKNQRNIKERIIQNMRNNLNNYKINYIIFFSKINNYSNINIRNLSSKLVYSKD